MTTNKEEHQLTMSEIPEGPFNPAPASTTPCEPTASDVLCGRGGTINTHPGNAKYRQLVEQRKRVYLTARFKREKRLISESIIKEIQGLKEALDILESEAALVQRSSSSKRRPTKSMRGALQL